MNAESHIIARLGLDKSQFESGMRNVKGEIKSLKEVFKLGGAVAAVVGLTNAVQQMADAGSEAIKGLSKAWSDRFKDISTSIGETKSGISALLSALVYAGTILPTALARFQGALSAMSWRKLFSKEGLAEAISIALDTGRDEFNKRLAPALAANKKAWRDVGMDSRTPQQRKEILLQELDALVAQRNATKDRVEWLNKDTEVANKALEIQKLQKDIQQDIDKERNESLRETEELENKRKARLKELVDTQRQLADAVNAERIAKQRIQDTRRDRSSLTLEEIAGGPIVNRFTLDQARMASQVQYAEAYAKEARRRGLFGLEEMATSRALQLRQMIPGLSAAERDPMASVKETLAESSTHLKRLADDAEGKGLNVKQILAQ